MSISEATLKALKQLGLTEYETQAYLTLVAGGQMAASDVSTKSKVPFSRIYDVLGRLEEKQFVQVRKGRPTNYVAKAPTEVMRLIGLIGRNGLRNPVDWLSKSFNLCSSKKRR